MLSRCSIAILGALLLACVGCGKEAQGEPVVKKEAPTIGGVGSGKGSHAGGRMRGTGRQGEKRSAIVRSGGDLPERLT